MQPTPTRLEVRSFETGPDERLTLPALYALFQEAARRNAGAMGVGPERAPQAPTEEPPR